MFNVEVNAARESFFSKQIQQFIPYEDMGPVSKEMDVYDKIDRIFYRKDIDKEVRVQLKIRGSNCKKFEDAAFRYYGDPKKNEWDNTRADEYLKIVIAAPKAEDWTDNPEIIKIARFNIRKVKESRYRVCGYSYYRNPHKTSAIVLDDDNKLWVDIVKGNPDMLTIPMKINHYIPGAYEILYEK